VANPSSSTTRRACTRTSRVRRFPPRRKSTPTSSPSETTIVLELIIVGAALGALGTSTALLAVALRAERRERRDANERLVGAWKDGYIVPAAQAQSPVAPVVEEEGPALIPELQALIDDWEEPRAQEAQRKLIRSYLDRGMAQPEVLRLIAPSA
jgi:hypothetical protein